MKSSLIACVLAAVFPCAVFANPNSGLPDEYSFDEDANHIRSVLAESYSGLQDPDCISTSFRNDAGAQAHLALGDAVFAVTLKFFTEADSQRNAVFVKFVFAKNGRIVDSTGTPVTVSCWLR